MWGPYVGLLPSSSSSGLSSTLSRPLPSSLAAPPRSSSSSLATEAPRRRPDPRAARHCPAPGSADRARAVSLAAGHGGSWRGHGNDGPLLPPSPSRSSSRGGQSRAPPRPLLRGEQGRARAAGERPPCSRRAVSRAAPPHLELAHALAPAARRRYGRRRCHGGGGGPPSAPARRESSEGARPSQAAEPRGGAPAKAGGGATGSPPRR